MLSIVTAKLENSALFRSYCIYANFIIVTYISIGRTTFERIFNFRCFTFERKSFIRL